jgi:hypothetical protein
MVPVTSELVTGYFPGNQGNHSNHSNVGTIRNQDSLGVPHPVRNACSSPCKVPVVFVQLQPKLGRVDRS